MEWQGKKAEGSIRSVDIQQDIQSVVACSEDGTIWRSRLGERVSVESFRRFKVLASFRRSILWAVTSLMLGLSGSAINDVRLLGCDTKLVTAG